MLDVFYKVDYCRDLYKWFGCLNWRNILKLIWLNENYNGKIRDLEDKFRIFRR